MTIHVSKLQRPFYAEYDMMRVFTELERTEEEGVMVYFTLSF
jgi:hypothetical protein